MSTSSIVHVNPYGPQGQTYHLSTSTKIPFQLLPESMGQKGPEFLFQFSRGSGLSMVQNKKVNKDGQMMVTDGTLSFMNLGQLTVESKINEWDSKGDLDGAWLSDGGFHYIGLSSNPNADYGSRDVSYDGWLRLKVDPCEETLTVYDWAYTTQPCRPIEVGQIPEAQSSVIFALCVLLLAFRRVRSWF
jgi:hypothetical protein